MKVSKTGNSEANETTSLKVDDSGNITIPESNSVPNNTVEDPDDVDIDYTADAWNNLRITWIEYLRTNKKIEESKDDNNFKVEKNRLERNIYKLLVDLKIVKESKQSVSPNAEQDDSTKTQNINIENEIMKQHFSNSGHDVRHVLKKNEKGDWMINKYDCEECKKWVSK